MAKKEVGTQKGGIERVRKVFAIVPEDVYKALKHHSVEHDIEMREIVAEALRRYLGLKGGDKDKK
jgi:hypothetical protein